MSNPFAILEGVLKGHSVPLRPVQFDDDNYDKEYRRSNGEFIRPTMCVTTCPECGRLIEQHIETSVDLGAPVPTYCDTCHPYIQKVIVPPVYPFRDPISTGVLVLFDVNPTALNNIDAMFIDEDNDEKSLLIEEVEDPMVERRSEGLGQFIRRRDQWKKVKQPVDTADEAFIGNSDVFDVMGELMGNTPDQIPSDFDPDGNE